MTPNKENLRERFLRDPLPKRLGGLAATLGRISSVARVSSDASNIIRLLGEAKYFIEWTAADAEPEVASELVSMQTLINLWLAAWDNVYQNKAQRTLLSVQAKQWSDRVLDLSGLLNQSG
jgi:hypothetical protein